MSFSGFLYLAASDYLALGIVNQVLFEIGHFHEPLSLIAFVFAMARSRN